MTAAPKIDVRDLKSVRAAARTPDLVLGEDWVGAGIGKVETVRRGRLATLRHSPIARKIVTFNLVALILLIAGVLYLSPSRNSLAFQRAKGLVNEAQLIASVFEAQLPSIAPVNLVSADGIDPEATLAALDLRGGVEVSVFSTDAVFVTRSTGRLSEQEAHELEIQTGDTFVTDFFAGLWERARDVIPLKTSEAEAEAEAEPKQIALSLDSVQRTIENGTQLQASKEGGNTSFIVTTPILRNGVAVGVIAVTTAAGEVDSLVRREREQFLRLFLVGILVSVGLSLVLASTIANPLAQLATAAEASQEKNARKISPVKVHIPDFTGRPDEIGRLSGALRSMVRALYQRIEGNEQFAADVAHEIKNPLASLRSAVGTMRVAKREDQREQLLVIIEHDVKRLDRLVSDISNASRLDSELVKEEEETFDLVQMLRHIADFLGNDARLHGVDFVADLPAEAIMVQGLEGRLAQVFVNLISNAISFCEKGDAIRIWARTRKNRVLVVVEDTGPGIPDDSLTKIFQRFYSQRPAGQFGNNSGLGLAISRQIVTAHAGVIWAENIRANDADPASEPLGARFVVGLPI